MSEATTAPTTPTIASRFSFALRKCSKFFKRCTRSLCSAAVNIKRRIVPPEFHSRPEHGKWQAGMNHHRDRGSDSEFNDPGGWNKASYTPDFLDEIEPLPDAPNDYRQAAIFHLRLMYVVDEFITAAPDARVAVVAVAVVLGWPSARGLSVGNIADQLGCSLSTLTRSIARFKAIAGLGSAGGVRFVSPGAGLNDDKPAAVQA